MTIKQLPHADCHMTAEVSIRQQATAPPKGGKAATWSGQPSPHQAIANCRCQMTSPGSFWDVLAKAVGPTHE